MIIVPYFRARWAFIDPTHRHFFTAQSFSYFDPGHVHNKLYPYSSAAFNVERVNFNEEFPFHILKTPLAMLATRHPTGYETYLSHLFPLDCLTFHLRALK